MRIFEFSPPYPNGMTQAQAEQRYGKIGAEIIKLGGMDAYNKRPKDAAGNLAYLNQLRTQQPQNPILKTARPTASTNADNVPMWRYPGSTSEPSSTSPSPAGTKSTAPWQYGEREPDGPVTAVPKEPSKPIPRVTPPFVPAGSDIVHIGSPRPLDHTYPVYLKAANGTLTRVWKSYNKIWQLDKTMQLPSNFDPNQPEDWRKITPATGD